MMDTQFELETLVRQTAATVEAIAKKLGINNGPDIADPSELEGDYGDPLIKYEIKTWKGPSMAGKNFSHLDSAELEFVAKDKARYADWCAAEAQKLLPGQTDSKGRDRAYYEKAVRYALKDARLARGWAKRVAGAGYQKPVQQALGADEVPF